MSNGWWLVAMSSGFRNNIARYPGQMQASTATCWGGFIDVCGLHMDMDGGQRDTVLRNFGGGGGCRVLVTVDELARGIGGGRMCRSLSWSITTVLPVSTTGEYETYAQRIANFTAREFGRQLVAVNLLAQGDVRTMREIEQVH